MGVTVVELALANLLYCLEWKSAKAIDINMEEAAGLTISKKMVKCADTTVLHLQTRVLTCLYTPVYRFVCMLKIRVYNLRGGGCAVLL